jgi:transposase-like protein
MEKSWLKLAESYEFSERLDRFMDNDFPKHPICPSCAVPMWLVEINSTPAEVECRYKCKACDRTILLRDGEPVH